jgi:hypothetical protein
VTLADIIPSAFDCLSLPLVQRVKNSDRSPMFDHAEYSLAVRVCVTILVCESARTTLVGN